MGIHPDGLQPGLDECGGWECGVPRVAKGQKDRAKRLKALGNAIVPQCAAFVLRHVLSGSIEKGPERHTVESHGGGDIGRAISDMTEQIGGEA